MTNKENDWTLYTYVMTDDTGLAPNPYGGVCTLAVCKPDIRRVAKIGDWIVGTGSKVDHKENRVIYAMKVTGIMRFEEYNDNCLKHLDTKIPDLKHFSYERIVGDCIYYKKDGEKDFRKRPNIQDLTDCDSGCSDTTDKNLKGVNVLLSDYFFYFGNKPAELPKELLNIVKKGAKHKSTSNNGYRDKFLDWVQKLTDPKNTIINEPYLKEKVLKRLGR